MRARVSEVDVDGVLRAAATANRAALGVTAENVLSDCRPYVPYDSGALRGSGETRLEDSAAYVEWGGTEDTSRYAREQYYVAHDHDTAQNAMFAPNACDHWYEHARADRGDAWLRMYEKTLREGT